MEENKLNQLASLNEIVCARVRDRPAYYKPCDLALKSRSLFRPRLPPRIRALRCELGELKQRL